MKELRLPKVKHLAQNHTTKHSVGIWRCRKKNQVHELKEHQANKLVDTEGQGTVPERPGTPATYAGQQHRAQGQQKRPRASAVRAEARDGGSEKEDTSRIP